MQPLELPDLDAVLSDIDWTVPDAPAHATLHLRWRYREVFAERLVIATGQDIDVFKLLRNDLADAPHDTVPSFRVLLALIATLGNDVHRTEARGLLDELPATRDAGTLGAMLITGGRMPTQEDYRYGLTGEAWLHRMVLFGSRPVDHDAHQLARRVRRFASDARFRKLGDPTQLLTHLWQRKALPPFKAEDFALLPSALRVAILDSAAARTVLLECELDARLRAAPYDDPDTPESRALRDDARRAIAHRDFAFPGLLVLPRRLPRRELVRMMLDAVADTTSALGAPPRPAPDEWLATLSGLREDAPRLDLVIFAALPLDERLPWVASLDSARARRVIEHGTPVDWLWALVGASSDGDREVWLDRLPGATSRIIASLMRQYQPDLLARSRSLMSRWEASLSDYRLDSGLRDERDVIQPAGQAGTLTPRLVTALRSALSDRFHAAAFIAAFGEPTIGMLLAQDADATVPRLHKAISRTPESSRAATVRRVTREVTRIAPRYLREFVSEDVSGTTLLETVGNLPTNVSLDDLSWVLELRTRSGAPSWLAAIRRCHRLGGVVPDVLRALVLTGDDDTLTRAALTDPDGFLDDALDRVPLTHALRLAFAFPAAAASVERSVGRAALREQIAWVREEFAHAPGKAVAYELALAFSLVDAPRFVRLARMAAEAKSPGRAFDDLYRTYDLPKQAGGTRTITVPADSLKWVQRRLLHNGFAEIPVHDAAHGFRPGRSVLTNARPHVGQPLVVNADIESFFPSTTHAQVLRACRRLLDGRLSEAAVRLVADICCYGGALPTGAPTSPAIANIVLAQADQALTTVAERHGVAYTRYADDLTFSGGDDAKRIIPFVRTVLADYGYELDDQKLNLYRRGRRQIVAGLVVNDKPNIARRVRRRLRAAVHARCHGRTPTWHGRPMSDDELRGWIAYLHIVQPDEAATLRAQLEAALGGENAA